MKVGQIVVITLIAGVIESARILGVIPTPSYSHQVVFQPLWKELSLRGHQVTVLTTNPIKDSTLTNLTEIDLGHSITILENRLSEIINSNQNPFKVIMMSVAVFQEINEWQLQHPEVQKLINDPDQHFDLLIVEHMLPAMFYFSKRFKCPYIGVMTVDASNHILRSFGNPAHPIVYSDVLTQIFGKPNLIQSALIVIYEAFMYFIAHIFRSKEQEIAWTYFKDDTPIDQIETEISLLFINSDPVFHYVRPLLPSVIHIGGALARIPTKPLEAEVKNFLDQSTEGFIYFSLGSNVNSKDIPPHTINVILETFRKLPYKILWKYELSELSNKPSNVLISKWLCQMEVLAHRNIKLFITHGGIHSMQETISSRVPVVGMPFFVDQPFNVKKMVAMGFAQSVDYKTMTVDEFQTAILEVIQNPRYKDRIRELADLSEDQPMTGLQRAVWWTEYVLRHKGAPHFRSPYLDIPWYQYFLLDVFAVILIALCVIIFTTFKFIKLISWTIKYLFIKPKKVKSS